MNKKKEKDKSLIELKGEAELKEAKYEAGKDQVEYAFTFSKHQITIMAKNIVEARKKLQKLIKSEEK